MFSTIFLGHPRAGTSSLTRRIAGQVFEEETNRATLFNFYTLTNPQIDLYDSASQDRFSRDLFIQQKQIYVYCIDLTCELNDILEKMSSFFLSQKIQNPTAKFIVAGTKSDLVSGESSVTQKQAQIQDLLNQRFPDARYRTTSSKTGQGIEELRQLICQIYFEPIFDKLKTKVKKILSKAQYLKFETAINAYFLSPTEDNLNTVVNRCKSIDEHKSAKNIIIPLAVSLFTAMICFSVAMTLGVFLAPTVMLTFLGLTAIHFGLIAGVGNALIGGGVTFAITKNSFFKTNHDALNGLDTAMGEFKAEIAQANK